jgi:hypothetical protein
MTSMRASRVTDRNGRIGLQGLRGDEPKRRRVFSVSDKIAHLQAYERADHLRMGALRTVQWHEIDEVITRDPTCGARGADPPRSRLRTPNQIGLL